MSHCTYLGFFLDGIIFFSLTGLGGFGVFGGLDLLDLGLLDLGRLLFSFLGFATSSSVTSGRLTLIIICENNC